MRVLPQRADIMSLNRFEQTVFDYIQNHVDERQFWREKVREVAAADRNHFAVGGLLEIELRRYCLERSHVVAPIRDFVNASPNRLSLRNLAEHLLRIWGPVRPAKAPDPR